MTKIHLIPKQKNTHGYKIVIKNDLLSKIPKRIKKWKYSKFVIITDSNVKKLYGDTLKKDLTALGLNAELISFKAGESAKKIQTIEKIIDTMLEKNVDRKACILALGGGVTGDIAGYTAASFMRGIDYVHIPTTLLAMTDSSIGGKTGVNSKKGKNLIGAFHQPKEVLIDPKVLNTLPKKEFINGMAEVIKAACIRDKKFFKYLEKHSKKILSKDSRKLKKVISKAATIKAEIVAKDTRENGLRMILNYGHTYGHALEKVMKYKMHHGFAVSIGIVIINNMAVKEHLMKEKDANRIKDVLHTYSLPITLPKKITLSALEKNMSNDKKFSHGHKYLIIVPRIGTSAIVEI